MTKCRNFIIYVAVTTNGTSVGGVTGFGTSGVGYYCLVIVAKCINFIVNVTIATNGTSVGGVTCFGTSRFSYYAIVIVTKCRSVFLLSVITIVLTSKGGYACFGTSCRSRSSIVPFVCFRVDGNNKSFLGGFLLISIKNVVTNGTFIVCFHTGCTTSCVYFFNECAI